MVLGRMLSARIRNRDNHQKTKRVKVPAGHELEVERRSNVTGNGEVIEGLTQKSPQ